MTTTFAEKRRSCVFSTYEDEPKNQIKLSATEVRSRLQLGDYTLGPHARDRCEDHDIQSPEEIIARAASSRSVESSRGHHGPVWVVPCGGERQYKTVVAQDSQREDWLFVVTVYVVETTKDKMNYVRKFRDRELVYENFEGWAA